jgi:hypothetical protein
VDARNTHGAVSWFELVTASVQAAGDFYNGLFGWQIRQIEQGGAPYWLIWLPHEGGEQLLGGMEQGAADQADGKTARVQLYVTVDDVQATLKRAVALGGAVVTPLTHIPGQEWMAAVRSPGGEVVCVVRYEPGAESNV